MATTVIDAGPAPASDLRARIRSFRAPWRSPADQPRHARPVLLGIAALAAVLYAWGIGHSQYHAFYADAVRSMSESWKAFFYGSFDPGNTITIDKLPGFMWPQALSARIFGFSPWSVTLPQVVEGVLSVLVMYRVVRRWAGANAGLLAAGAFAVTPVVVGIFRGQTEDALFTLLVLLAADAAQRAAREARLRPLVLSAVWVGLSFQSKMLEAWAVLPALALVYLVSAPAPLRRRLAHIGVAGAVAVAVSASWMVIVSLVPANDRPYIDGTTDNSPFSMVVGYNFLNRFSSVGLDASSTGSVSASRGGAGGGGGYAGFGGGGNATGADRSGHARLGSGAAREFGGAGATGANGFPMAGGQGMTQHRGGGGSENGWGKMFGSALASQTGWLYPFAALAAICGLVWPRRRPRTDPLRAGYLLFTAWLAVFFLVFSAGSVGGHTYYMGVIAAPLAALTGAGAVLFWRAFRSGRKGAWALPTAVAATAVWSAVLVGGFPSYLPWLAPALLVVAAAAVVVLLLGLRRGRGRRLAVTGLAAGLVAVLAAPAAWAGSVFNSAADARGSMMGSVGPGSGFGGSGGHGGFGRLGAFGDRTGGGQDLPEWAQRAIGQGGGEAGEAARQRARTAQTALAGMFGGGQTLTAQQRSLLAYTEARSGRKAAYAFATTSWSAASPYILASGASVMPMGGFTGQAPSPTLAQVHEEVGTGKLRFFLLNSGSSQDGSGFGRTGGSARATAIAHWVRTACEAVPASAYGGSAASGQQLYDCTPSAAQHAGVAGKE